jgi:hypothetical protein
VENKGIKNLAELIYDPEDDLFLSKQAAIGVARRFYKKLDENAEKFVSFYESNKDETDKLLEKYMELTSMQNVSNLLYSLMDKKAMQSLIYKILLNVESDLRKNSYDLKKVYKEADKKIKRNYRNLYKSLLSGIGSKP